MGNLQNELFESMAEKLAIYKQIFMFWGVFGKFFYFLGGPP